MMTPPHTVRRWRTQAFEDCAAPDWCNPKAHHHVVDTIQCFYGATRQINVNGPYREIGPWERPITEEQSHE
jgi:hypothetical protein